jgi:hypothetical protein
VLRGGNNYSRDRVTGEAMKTRVTCYFEPPNPEGAVIKSKLGPFTVYYVDCDVDERDSKAEVKKSIALATGLAFKAIKIRLGGFNEILAFDANNEFLRVGSCGSTEATYDKALLRAHELNNLGAGSAFDLPDFDRKKYDGRYDWVQIDPEKTPRAR